MWHTDLVYLVDDVWLCQIEDVIVPLQARGMILELLSWETMIHVHVHMYM